MSVSRRFLLMLGSHCRAIRYECHDWPFVAGRGIFSEISGLDTRWCESIRSDTICCSRSDPITICPFQVHDQSRSDLPFRYDHIRSNRIVAIESTIGSGSDTIITIGFSELRRSDTFRYVHHEPMRSVTIAYDCGVNVFHDNDRGWSRFELRLDPDGYIYAAGLIMEFIVSWVFTA